MEKFLYNSKIYKNGFTLSEVLITLVVIGVVASMTIPNVIHNTRKQEYSARLKKFYSIMKQTQLMAEVNGKSWYDWANTASHKVYGTDIMIAFQDEYLLPYLSYHKTEIDNSNSLFRKVYLNDGSSFYTAKGDCIDFKFDVNGDKLPNKSGKDIFLFLYCPMNDAGMWTIKGEFIPYQPYQYGRDTAWVKCANQPDFCSALLMIDGWEFKSDYPYLL